MKLIFINNKKIIIFGSKGFLGSTISKMFGEGMFTGINNLDLLSEGSIEQCDILINCGDASSVSCSLTDPSNDFERNVTLVKNILEKIRLSGNKNIRFINFSSAAVHGNPKNLPIRETDFCHPISPYGSHKMMTEELCRYYYNCFGIKTLSLRIFSAYGIGPKKILLRDLHEKILNSNGEITLFGTGNETRDFIHTEDIYRQLLLAIENSNFDGEAVNVANGKGVYV